MRSADDLAAVAAEWVLKAEEDLDVAAHLLTVKRRCPTATVGFHAQQCVEKYLKAVLVTKGIEFPKTHDIEKLVGLLPLGIRISLPIAAQRLLTTYATVTRYPGNHEPVTRTEARQAVALARRVGKSLQGFLPAV